MLFKTAIHIILYCRVSALFLLISYKYKIPIRYYIRIIIFFFLKRLCILFRIFATNIFEFYKCTLFFNYNLILFIIIHCMFTLYFQLPTLNNSYYVTLLPLLSMRLTKSNFKIFSLTVYILCRLFIILLLPCIKCDLIANCLFHTNTYDFTL